MGLMLQQVEVQEEPVELTMRFQLREEMDKDMEVQEELGQAALVAAAEAVADMSSVLIYLAAAEVEVALAVKLRVRDPLVALAAATAAVVEVEKVLVFLRHTACLPEEPEAMVTKMALTAEKAPA